MSKVALASGWRLRALPSLPGLEDAPAVALHTKLGRREEVPHVDTAPR